MKINPITSSALYQQYETSRVQNIAAPSHAMGVDRAELSSDAMSFAKVYREARMQVRGNDDAQSAQKVEALKKQVDEGTYHVDSNVIADRMMFNMRSGADE